MGLDNPLHLAFIVVLLLLVFGAKRLPEIGRSLGAGMRGFKESINGETTSHHETLASAEATPTSSPSISRTPAETDRAGRFRLRAGRAGRRPGGLRAL